MKRRMGKSNNYSMLRSLCLLEKIFWGQNAVTNKKCVKCSQIHIYQHGRVWGRSVRIFKKMVSLPSKNFRNINRNKQPLIVGQKCLWSFLDLRDWWLRRKQTVFAKLFEANVIILKNLWQQHNWDDFCSPFIFYPWVTAAILQRNL